MSVTTRQSEIDGAAALWDIRLRSHACTDADREAFKAWRESDPRHHVAYERLQSALGTLRHAVEHPQLRALRERAEVMTRRSAARRASIRLSIAAGIAFTAMGIAALVGPHPWRPTLNGTESLPAALALDEHTGDRTYVTGARERRTIALPDGSTATLNAATRLETHWLAHERRVRLLSGQVMFRVAKDATRAFIVTAGDRTVTALGTAFDVRLDADKVQVTLLEGRVAVRGLGRAAYQPRIELTPNQQLVAIDGEAPIVNVVDVARSTGWAEGQVFFTDEALPAAVAEMNRYSAQEIVVGDSSLARYRINGMFRSGNQDGFVGAVTTYYPIDAHRDDQGRIVLVPRPQQSWMN
jgi:transmembrane sensor